MHGEKYRAVPVAHTHGMRGVHAQKAFKGGRVGAQRRTSLAQGPRRQERRSGPRAGRGRAHTLLAEWREGAALDFLDADPSTWTLAQSVVFSVMVSAFLFAVPRIIGWLAVMFG